MSHEIQQMDWDATRAYRDKVEGALVDAGIDGDKIEALPTSDFRIYLVDGCIDLGEEDALDEDAEPDGTYWVATFHPFYETEDAIERIAEGRNLLQFATDLAFWINQESGTEDALLAEVRAAAEALALAEARRLGAIRAAFDAGRNRTQIAEAAGMTRDGVYKLLKWKP